ncbi:hypothetical protein HDU76_012544 [Blyttiomyces sp. JEL0837]|nr:hypothetical protein HDU76_012544 [Blyttiomyces sp. JEL0837]
MKDLLIHIPMRLESQWGKDSDVREFLLMEECPASPTDEGWYEREIEPGNLTCLMIFATFFAHEETFVAGIQLKWMSDEDIKDGKGEFHSACRIALRIAAERGHVGLVILFLSWGNLYKSSNCSTAIRNASHGHSKIVKLLLEAEGVDGRGSERDAIPLAAAHGHIKVLRLLIEVKGWDPATSNNQAIRSASQNGHDSVVSFLLSREGVNPAASHNESLRLASENGHIQVVERLVRTLGVDPTALNDAALRQASAMGHEEIVRLRLSIPTVNPAAQDNLALRLSCKNGHIGVVKTLLSTPQ